MTHLLEYLDTGNKFGLAHRLVISREITSGYFLLAFTKCEKFNDDYLFGTRRSMTQSVIYIRIG